ncbi:MAG: hypothetical protein ACR2LA_10270 [Acidimicrobiales bacterium]
MTRVRLLLVASALSAVVALGVTWTLSPGDAGFLSPGSTTLTNQYNPVTGGLDLVPQYNPGFYIVGSPGLASAGYADDVRVGLVPATGMLVTAALWPSRRTRRATVVAAAALVLCALWGIGHGLVQGPLLAAGAAALAAFAVRRPARRPVAAERAAPTRALPSSPTVPGTPF